MRSTSHFDSSRFDLFRDFLVFEVVPEWTQTCDSLLSNRSLLGPSTTLGIGIYRQAEPCPVRCYSEAGRRPDAGNGSTGDVFGEYRVEKA